MSNVVINPEIFEMPGDFDATTYFNDCFGIMTSQGEAKNILIRVTPIKAKYFVAFYGIVELFFGVAGAAGDNVAHFAHLGGMLFGLILILYWRKKGIGGGPYF